MNPDRTRHGRMGWLALAWCVSSGCPRLEPYDCRDAADCDRRLDGVCISGSCAYPDPSCVPTGLRYSPNAQRAPGACVEADGTTISEEATASLADEHGDLPGSVSNSTETGDSAGTGCVVESFDAGLPPTWAAEADVGTEVMASAGTLHFIVEGEGAPRYASIVQMTPGDFDDVVIELDVIGPSTPANVGTVSLQLNTSEETGRRYAFVVGSGQTYYAEDFDDMGVSTVQQTGPLPVPLPTHWRVSTRPGGARWELSEDGRSWATVYDGEVPVQWNSARVRIGAGTWAEATQQLDWTIDEIRICPAL